MNIKHCVTLAAAVLALSAPLRSADSAPAATFVITASDSLRFSVTRIEVRPGQTVRVQLRNVGVMPKTVMGHNWILLRAGSDISGYATAAISAAGEGYQPHKLSGEVLAAIPLLGPKQSGEVTFQAPTVPGEYPFICSFPGHMQAGMHGVLAVK